MSTYCYHYFFKWATRGRAQWNNLHKVTWFVRGKAGVQNHTVPVHSLCTWALNSVVCLPWVHGYGDFSHLCLCPHVTYSLPPEICSTYSCCLTAGGKHSSLHLNHKDLLHVSLGTIPTKMSWIGAHFSPMWEVIRPWDWGMEWIMVPILRSLSLPLLPLLYSCTWMSPEILVLIQKSWNLDLAHSLHKHQIEHLVTVHREFSHYSSLPMLPFSQRVKVGEITLTYGI